MELHEVTEAFSSLSQETRLRVFKLLIEYGCGGAVPSQLAHELKIPDNTLSFHLSQMSRAGLVTSKRNGRSINYVANPDLIANLIDYLQMNCCAREDKTKSTKRKPRNERKC
jgi:ArsR family transcriptional regulator, arsenate/arsenite/antimonite-responsive transcriptional repressor